MVAHYFLYVVIIDKNEYLWYNKYISIKEMKGDFCG